MLKRLKQLLTGFLVLTLALALPLPVAALSGETMVYNGIGASDDFAVSGDGGTVAFVTTSALVGSDTNSKADVYVYDVAAETYDIASVTSSEAISTDGNSTYVGLALSYNGQYVLFSSNVTDLVTGDTNAVRDVFLRDRTAGSTERISVDSSEGELNAGSFDPSVTNNGQFVVFWTAATDVIGGSDTNGFIDVFMRNRTAGTTERVSLDSSEAQLTGGSSWVEGNSISADGRYIAFMSYATNAVAGDTNADGDVFLRDTVDGTTIRVSLDENGDEVADFSEGSVITNNGQFVVFRSGGQLVAADDQAFDDVYVYEVDTGEVRLASTNKDGVVGDGHSNGGQSNEMFVSADGRFVLFDSTADNLIAGYTPPVTATLFVKDMETGEVEMVNDDFTQDRYGMTDDGSQVLYRNGDSHLILGAVSNADPDNDNIPNDVEYAAPDDGDGNLDGIPDAEQANVASYVNPVTGEYAVLEVSDECAITNVVSSAESSNQAADSGFDYPSGLMTFSLACDDPGETTTVRQIYYNMDFVPFLEARKYNDTTDTYQGIEGAAIQANSSGAGESVQVTYQITDGGPLDEDGTVDTFIVDPSGLGVNLAPDTGLQPQSAGMYAAAAVLGATSMTVAARMFVRHARGRSKA